MKRRPARLIFASLILGTLLTACQMSGVTLGGGYAGGFGGSSSGGGGIGVNFNLGDIFGWNQAKGDIGTLSRPGTELKDLKVSRTDGAVQGTYDYTLTGLGSNAADAPARIQVSIPCGGSVTDPGALSSRLRFRAGSRFRLNPKSPVSQRPAPRTTSGSRSQKAASDFLNQTQIN